MSDDPEKWEAKELIEDLKSGIAHPGDDQRSMGICPYHNSLAKGIIWIIRRLNNQTGGNWFEWGKLKVHGTQAILILAVAYLIWMQHQNASNASIDRDQIGRIVEYKLNHILATQKETKQ